MESRNWRWENPIPIWRKQNLREDVKSPVLRNRLRFLGQLGRQNIGGVRHVCKAKRINGTRNISKPSSTYTLSSLVEVIGRYVWMNRSGKYVYVQIGFKVQTPKNFHGVHLFLAIMWRDRRMAESTRLDCPTNLFQVLQQELMWKIAFDTRHPLGPVILINMGYIPRS